MAPELLALAAALCYAASTITVKLAARSGDTHTGFLLGLLVSLVGLAIVTPPMVQNWSMPLPAFLLFAATGVTDSGVGRALSMWGVRLAGASVSGPVQVSAHPLVATLAGVLLFSETVGPARLAAIALILAGVWLAARGGSANVGIRTDGHHRWVVLVPLAAGATFAATDVLRKLALDQGGDPALGTLVSIVAAVMLWAPLTALPGRRPVLRPDRSWGWYAVYGGLTGAAQLFIVLALLHGDISAVSPILSSQPVIVLLLSALLLRKLERLRAGTVLGALVVFSGVAWITQT